MAHSPSLQINRILQVVLTRESTCFRFKGNQKQDLDKKQVARRQEHGTGSTNMTITFRETTHQSYYPWQKSIKKERVIPSDPRDILIGAGLKSTLTADSRSTRLAWSPFRHGIPGLF